MPAEGYLLCEKVADPVGLVDAAGLLAGRPVGERKELQRTWADRLARVVRAMHDRGVSHRDLKAPNVLLEGAAGNPRDAAPVLIDLVGVRTGRAGVEFRQRAKELARLNASFIASPLVSRTDRLRFLWAYLGAGEVLTGDWKSWWKAVTRATARKVEKNRRNARPLT